MPGATHVAILLNPTRPEAPIHRTWNERAAAMLGLTLEFVDASRPEDVRPALGRVAASRPVEEPTRYRLVINLKTARGPRAHDPAVAPAAGGSG